MSERSVSQIQNASKKFLSNKKLTSSDPLSDKAALKKVNVKRKRSSRSVNITLKESQETEQAYRENSKA